jgi:type III secretory pathway component EscV
VNTTLGIVAYSENTAPTMTTPDAQINTWWAYSVQVRYQASDSAVLGRAIVGATGGSSSSLSIGAAIGIGFGCGIAAIMFLGGVLLLCFSKRRNRRAREASAAAMNSEARNSEKRQDVASWQTTDSTQTHQNYPTIPILAMDQGGQYIQVPVELATRDQRSELSVSTPMELPTNISHYQHDSQTSIPFSSPSLSHTSQGHVSQSPNFFQQQQQFSQ